MLALRVEITIILNNNLHIGGTVSVPMVASTAEDQGALELCATLSVVPVTATLENDVKVTLTAGDLIPPSGTLGCVYCLCFCFSLKGFFVVANLHCHTLWFLFSCFSC